MSHITLANQGLAAADGKSWDEAITKLSKALQASANPAWLLARSKALINVNRYQEALDDAELAFHKAFDRNKRELMIEAHYRRAVAYYRLKQYANADCCAIYAMRLVKGNPALEKEDIKTTNSDEDGFWTPTAEEAMTEARDEPFNQPSSNVSNAEKLPPNVSEWRRASTIRIRALTEMQKLPADDEARKVTVSLKPKLKELAALKSEKEAVAPKSAPIAQTPVVPSDAPLRLQDFQTNTAMSVSIFSKGVNREKLNVEFLPTSVRLNPLVYPNGEEKEFVLETYAEISPSESFYVVTPSKVEVRLVKKVPGKWPQFAKPSPAVEKSISHEEELQALKDARKRAMDEADAKAKERTEEKTNSSNKGKDTAGPAYPTSSRSGPKDWDKIGEEGDEEEEAGVNDFFKKLYSGATPEQQRAMMKSFTESNGTSLSTDWDDVSKRTVETVPPEGVEAKKW